MKIRAFTLAEVLIVLTILGVIAAMTLPALNTNVQKQQVGPALLRAISTFETANVLVAQEHDFYNFAESCSNYLNDCFEPFVKEKLGAAKLDETIEYGKHNDPSRVAVRLRNAYLTKNGMLYNISSTNSPNRLIIAVDVNGTKRPNIVAKDLFYLLLVPENESCKVFAVGSRALAEYASSHNEISPIFLSTWDRPYTGLNGSACNADGLSGSPNGFYCAGSIVDNGGRVIYPW